MYTNLIRLIENLLNCHQYETVDTILSYLDIEHSGNALTEYVDILNTCLTSKEDLRELPRFHKRLKEKMINERGECAAQFTLSKFQVL